MAPPRRPTPRTSPGPPPHPPGPCPAVTLAAAAGGSCRRACAALDRVTTLNEQKHLPWLLSLHSPEHGFNAQLRRVQKGAPGREPRVYQILPSGARPALPPPAQLRRLTRAWKLQRAQAGAGAGAQVSDEEDADVAALAAALGAKLEELSARRRAAAGGESIYAALGRAREAADRAKAALAAAAEARTAAGKGPAAAGAAAALKAAQAALRAAKQAAREEEGKLKQLSAADADYYEEDDDGGFYD
jgi:hypothetical protein